MPQDISGFIKDQTVRRLRPTQVESTNLYLLRRVVKREAKVFAHRQVIAIPRDTLVVFADEMPRANWSHPCRYLLHDAHTGELYQDIPAQFPPDLTKLDPDLDPFHQPVKWPVKPILWPIRRRLRCPIFLPVGRRYAVLFSGASNNRHTNDLEYLYRTLRDEYYLRDEDIYCLNYDGTVNYVGAPQPLGNWPGDNTPYRMPVKGKGTKADLETVLDDLKTRLKPEDLLLIHTNNHGGWDGSAGTAYLVTQSGPDYYASDFGAKLAQLPQYQTLMVMMEQCHAGGFNAPILSSSTAASTTVASACVESHNSIGGADFDPFARDWISAVALHTTDGGALPSNPDTDGDGRVSAKEAFGFADGLHDPYDTPVYNENTAAAGDTHLGQRYRVWWFYCPLLVDLLEPHYLKLPQPEFHQKLEKVLPRLDEVVKGLDQTSEELKRKTKAQLEAILRQAF